MKDVALILWHVGSVLLGLLGLLSFVAPFIRDEYINRSAEEREFRRLRRWFWLHRYAPWLPNVAKALVIAALLTVTIALLK